MAGKVIVKKRDTEGFLQSPYKLDGEDECWMSGSKDVNDAHQFPNRKTAHETLRRITNGHEDDYQIMDYERYMARRSD